MATSSDPRRLRVAVLGGGMGGLSCAHELARENVSVTVYEASAHLGGKARSQYVPHTGTGGRGDLPGEHGFRFYPAFYRHVVATMKEIPDAESPTGTVAGNLVGTSEAGVAMRGEIIASSRRPRSLAEARRALESIRASGGGAGDLARYLAAHLKFLTSCDARRETQIEATPWARFIGADAPGGYAEDFRQVLLACTRTMVAMDAERGSSRTIGQASSLLLLDAFGAEQVDRTMMGPTTDCWIDPWQRLLEQRGVAFRFGHRIERLAFERGRVTCAWARDPHDEPVHIEADAFVLAVPLERALPLITPEMTAADPQLARLASTADVDSIMDWMVGAQFFLREDVPLCAGHLFFPDSAWSLTTISQAQFWNRGRRGMHRYGDGRLRGILSVDVSSSFAPDEDGVRLVDETSREGALDRVLRQILDAVDPATRRALERSVYAAKLDDELAFGPAGVTNAARLLVHPPGSRALRPSAALEIPNLCLAADYVKTEVDLASMEGANEAGRHAARAVLERAGLDASSVHLFAYEELDRFERLRALDGYFYARGLPHLFELGGSALDAIRSLGSAPSRILSGW